MHIGVAAHKTGSNTVAVLAVKTHSHSLLKDPTHSNHIRFRGLCPSVSPNSVRDAKCPGFFESCKGTTFLTMRANGLTFPQSERTSLEVGEPSARWRGR